MGSLKTEKREIDGVVLMTTQLPSTRAFRLFARLMRTLAPAAGALRFVTLEADITTLAPALGRIFEELNPDDAVALSLAALQSTAVIVDGKQIELTSEAMLDIAFAGKPLMILQAVKFAIEVNFADFFAALAAEAAKAAAAKTAAAVAKLPSDAPST
jgi:hypothetical protein